LNSNALLIALPDFGLGTGFVPKSPARVADLFFEGIPRDGAGSDGAGDRGDPVGNRRAIRHGGNIVGLRRFAAKCNTDAQPLRYRCTTAVLRIHSSCATVPSGCDDRLCGQKLSTRIVNF